jgi:hypothetical protein
VLEVSAGGVTASGVTLLNNCVTAHTQPAYNGTSAEAYTYTSTGTTQLWFTATYRVDVSATGSQATFPFTQTTIGGSIAQWALAPALDVNFTSTATTFKTLRVFVCSLGSGSSGSPLTSIVSMEGNVSTERKVGIINAFDGKIITKTEAKTAVQERTEIEKFFDWWDAFAGAKDCKIR